MPVELRDGTIVHDPRLDRLRDEDPRDANYSVCDIIGGQEQPVTTLWTIPAGEPVLDQGREGACTGYGVTNELRFSPVPVAGLDSIFAREQIYWPAQRGDDWPGGAYPGASPFYEGTSVRAAVKAAVKIGYVGEYRWAKNEDEVALAISAGPIIFGLDWHEGMSRPNSRGYLRPTGRLLGGHCLLGIGLDARYRYYTLYNSWGPSWGKNGTARISRADMATLLSRGGEACLITTRYNPPQPR